MSGDTRNEATDASENENTFHDAVEWLGMCSEESSQHRPAQHEFYMTWKKLRL